MTAINIPKLSIDVARRAHTGTSWVPEERATQEVESMEAHLAAKVAQAQASAAKHHMNVDALLQDYVDQYVKRNTRLLQQRSRIVSTFIAGRSGFNVRRAEKSNDAYDRALQEFIDWSGRAWRRVMDSTAPPKRISSDDRNAMSDLTKAVATDEFVVAVMVCANNIIRHWSKKGTEARQLDALEGLMVMGRKTAECLMHPDFGKPGYTFDLENLRKEVTRKKKRLADLEAMALRPEYRYVFPGGTAEEDAADNRLRVYYPATLTDMEARGRMKRNGFVWSGRNDAWQRMRGDGAVYALRNAVGPVELDNSDDEPGLADYAIQKVEDALTETMEETAS